MRRKFCLIFGLVLLVFISASCQKEGIKSAEEWQEEHPEVYASYLRNAEMQATTYGGSEPIDYLEEYPNLKTFYDGYGFSVEYQRARGHVHALDDVINTARPKPGASCLTCKTSDFIEVLEKDGIDVNKIDFEQFVSDHPGMSTISCYDCHRNKPGEVNITRAHLTDALAYADGEVATGNLACAQCHVEYYLDPETKAVILPWQNGVNTDDMLAYYDEVDFKDWDHPQTGAELLKAQHPEFETYTDSVHYNMGLSCIDCHMPQIEGNSSMKSHQWTSPLLSTAGIKQSCMSCHSGEPADMIASVEFIQKSVYEKQEEVSAELLNYVNRLSIAVKDGKINDPDLSELRDIHRKAQFKWDFVFVENGEGFHNSQKSHKNLDDARGLVQEGIKILEKYNY